MGLSALICVEPRNGPGSLWCLLCCCVQLPRFASPWTTCNAGATGGRRWRKSHDPFPNRGAPPSTRSVEELGPSADSTLSLRPATLFFTLIGHDLTVLSQAHGMDPPSGPWLVRRIKKVILFGCIASLALLSVAAQEPPDHF